MKKFYSRVPSKRVAMASRKVFCGARRPFITGIFTRVRDRQQLAEGHTIPGAQRTACRGVSGAAGGHCGDSGPELTPGICIYSHSAPQDPEHGLARLAGLIPNTRGGRFRRRKLQWVLILVGGSSSPGGGDRDRLFLFTSLWGSSSPWQHGGS